jgi:hypothetical protein
MFLRLMDEQFKLEEQLMQDKETLQRYTQAKLHVAEEVIAGQRSVAQALEALRWLAGQLLPNSTKQYVLKRWKMSEDEWLGMGVRYYVEQVLVARPYEAAAVVARLEEELQELLASRQKRPAAPAAKPIERSRASFASDMMVSPLALVYHFRDDGP